MGLHLIHMSDCCPTTTNDNNDACHTAKFDYILWGSLSVIGAALLLYAFNVNIPYVGTFAETIIEFLSKMWWGIVIGIVFVGLMSKTPKEYFNVLLGRGDKVSGIFRAMLAGLLLDLCSHGILMVGAKLYERGASIAQVITFLIASPWNSISMTFILIALIGLKWTLVFIALSAVIALVTGFIFQFLVRRGILPDNPHTIDTPEGFSIRADAKRRLKGFRFTRGFFIDIFKNSRHEAQMLLRWLLLGVVIAAALRTFVPEDMIVQWLGPSVLGLFVTLVATTVIEVCSEGSSPIAAEIMNSANAPGNAFTFLMAGVSTDYTEIMILKDTTKSWKIALFLPLVTVPQVLILGYILNVAGGG